MSFLHVAKTTFHQKNDSKYFGRGLWPVDQKILDIKRRKQKQYREELLKQIQESQNKKKRQKQQFKSNQIYYTQQKGFEKNYHQQVSLHDLNPQHINYSPRFSDNSTNLTHLRYNSPQRFKLYYDNQYKEKYKSVINEDIQSQNFEYQRSNRAKQQQQHLDKRIHEIYLQLSDSIESLKISQEIDNVKYRLRSKRLKTQTFEKKYYQEKQPYFARPRVITQWWQQR